MSIQREVNARRAETPLAQSGLADDVVLHAPRPATLAENVILTLKLIVGSGLIGAAIWGLDVWSSAP